MSDCYRKFCIYGTIVSVVLLMYLPTSTVSYVILGRKVEANILASIPRGAPATVVGILMTSHLMFATIIVLNPVSQDLERLLKIPTRKSPPFTEFSLFQTYDRDMRCVWYILHQFYIV